MPDQDMPDRELNEFEKNKLFELHLEAKEKMEADTVALLKMEIETQKQEMDNLEKENIYLQDYVKNLMDSIDLTTSKSSIYIFMSIMIHTLKHKPLERLLVENDSSIPLQFLSSDKNLEENYQTTNLNSSVSVTEEHSIFAQSPGLRIESANTQVSNTLSPKPFGPFESPEEFHLLKTYSNPFETGVDSPKIEYPEYRNEFNCRSPSASFPPNIFQIDSILSFESKSVKVNFDRCVSRLAEVGSKVDIEKLLKYVPKRVHYDSFFNILLFDPKSSDPEVNSLEEKLVEILNYEINFSSPLIDDALRYFSEKQQILKSKLTFKDYFWYYLFGTDCSGYFENNEKLKLIKESPWSVFEQEFWNDHEDLNNTLKVIPNLDHDVSVAQKTAFSFDSPDSEYDTYIAQHGTDNGDFIFGLNNSDDGDVYGVGLDQV